MRLRFRATQWADPWGIGMYGQRWRGHFQVNVAFLWWSFIVEFRRPAGPAQGFRRALRVMTPDLRASLL